MPDAADLRLTNVRLPDGGDPLTIEIRGGQIARVGGAAPDDGMGTGDGMAADDGIATVDGGGRVVLPRLVLQ